jgi:hypothetical protein
MNDMTGPNSPKPAPSVPVERMLRFSQRRAEREEVFAIEPRRSLFS